MIMPGIEVIGVDRMRQLGHIVAQEADTAKLKREMGKGLRAAAEPVVAEQKSRIMATGHHGDTPTRGDPLREYLTNSLKVRVRYTGRTAGVTIVCAYTPQLRKFKLAGRRFARRIFRHPFFGDRTRWYPQEQNDTDWFDGPPESAEALSAFMVEADAVLGGMEAKILNRHGSMPL